MRHDAQMGIAESSSTSMGILHDNTPRDAELPQLLLILDPKHMKEILCQGMFSSARERERFRIRGCEIIQVRYKPASSCMVSYRLEIEDRATGTTGEQILCGRAVPKGRSQSQWERAAARALVQPRFGKPLVHLPAIHMVLWSFPNDRKMRTLSAAVDAVHSASTGPPRWLLSRFGTEWQVSNTTSRVLRYVGEHTCTVQTSVELNHPSRPTRRTLSLFGKTYYDEEGAQTDRVMQQLWNSDSRRSGRLGIAEPLWYDARLKTLWQLGIHGVTLEYLTLDSPECISHLMKAARTIAVFHTTLVSDVRLVTVLDLLDTLEKVTGILLRSRPSCRPLLVPLVERLTAQAKTVSIQPTATLHGDLHMKNLLLTEDNIALIDLDNVCAGHPGQDLGSFVAGLLTGALAKQVPVSNLAAPVRAFLNHYDQCAPWKLDQPTLAWFTAVALVVERAHRSITRQKGNQRGHIEALLNYADQISEARSLKPLADV